MTKKVLSVVAGTLFLAASASAQEGSTGFSLGVGGGFAQASEQGVGYTVFSTLEFPSPFRVLRPRADVFFASWAASPHVTGVTGNILLTPFATRSVAPYLLVGAGAYIEEEAKPKAGATVGFGLRLPGTLRSVVIESQVQFYLLDHPRAGLYIPPGAVNDQSVKRSRGIWKPIGLAIQF